MKKTLAILAIALFIGGISVPVIAATNSNPTVISQRDEDPKKKESSEKTEKSAEQTKEATKSGDCSSEKKAETTTGEAKSDCSKK